jgi:hypothetical protein
MRSRIFLLLMTIHVLSNCSKKKALERCSQIKDRLEQIAKEPSGKMFGGKLSHIQMEHLDNHAYCSVSVHVTHEMAIAEAVATMKDERYAAEGNFQFVAYKSAADMKDSHLGYGLEQITDRSINPEGFNDRFSSFFQYQGLERSFHKQHYIVDLRENLHVHSSVTFAYSKSENEQNANEPIRAAGLPNLKNSMARIQEALPLPRL